jgi:hypothetical protein
MGEVREALLHVSDHGTPPDEATPDGTIPYRFNFLTQRWPNGFVVVIAFTNPTRDNQQHHHHAQLHLWRCRLWDCWRVE